METRWHGLGRSSQELFCFSSLLKTGSILDCPSTKSEFHLLYQEMLTVHWEIQVPQGRRLGVQSLLKLILEAMGSSSTTGIYPLLANTTLTHDPNGASTNTDKEWKISTENSHARPPTLSLAKEKLPAYHASWLPASAQTPPASSDSLH